MPVFRTLNDQAFQSLAIKYFALQAKKGAAVEALRRIEEEAENCRSALNSEAARRLRERVAFPGIQSA